MLKMSCDGMQNALSVGDLVYVYDSDKDLYTAHEVVFASGSYVVVDTYPPEVVCIHNPVNYKTPGCSCYEDEGELCFFPMTTENVAVFQEWQKQQKRQKMIAALGSLSWESISPETMARVLMVLHEETNMGHAGDFFTEG